MTDTRIPTAEDLGRAPDHASPADLALMASAMRKLEGVDREFFAEEMVTHGLMLPVGDGSDPVAQAMLEKVKSMNALPIIAKMMVSMDGMVDEIVEATAKHCEAGGWNEVEVLQAYASLYVARGGLTIPFGANVQ